MAEKKPEVKAVEVSWIGSPRKQFRGTHKVVDLRNCSAKRLEELKKKYPSNFKK